MAFDFITFKSGSYILVEDQRTHTTFYIVVNGKLKAYKNINPDQNILLGPGDFFGVESAMSQQTSIETVVAITDCKLIEVARDQFGTLIKHNAPVALKIIRSFSIKLRAFDEAITNYSKKAAPSTDNIEGLFQLGQFWQSKNEATKAIHAFQQYLKHAPTGLKVAETTNALKILGADIKNPNAEINKQIRLSLTEGTILFCEHEPGNDCFIIQSGRIKISKVVDNQETILAILQPGDIFGEMAIIEGKPRTATASVAEDTNLLRINKANFQELVKVQPILATKLITLLSERIWVAYRQLSNLLLSSVEARLYDLLLTFLYKEHITIGPRVAHSFNLRGSDLLKMAGLDPVKDENHLVELFSGNILKLKEGKIVCSDLDKLRDRVNFYRKQNDFSKKKKSSL